MGEFNLRRIVLDVVKSSGEPSLVWLAESISRVKGVESLNLTVEEVDSRTEGLLVTLEGQMMNYVEINKVITDAGAVIHSVDQVASGQKVIESVYVPLSRARR